MSYSTRTAVAHPTEPTISVSLFGATLPAIPSDGIGSNDGEAMPYFHTGASIHDMATSLASARTCMTGPGLFCCAYKPTGTIGFAGGTIMGGAPAGDYAIRPIGLDTITSDNVADPYTWTGYADGFYVALTDVFATGPTGGQVNFARQVIGNYTGGTYDAVAIGELGSVSFTLPDPTYAAAPMGVFPSSASTTTDPEVIVPINSYQPTGDIFALKMASTGPVSLIGLYQAGEPSNVIFSVIPNSNGYHILRQGFGGVETTGDSHFALTIVTGEAVWPELPSYVHYNLAVGGGTLPANLYSAGVTPTPSAGYDLDWQITNIAATELGFLFTFSNSNNDGTSTQRFFLFDKEWTYYQEILVTGLNSIANEVIAQGTDAAVLADNEFMFDPSPTSLIDMTYFDGVYYLLGGTNEVPKLLSTEAVVGNTDDDIRLRVWTFSLDGHDYFVLRIGLTETLVYDLTTSQWSHWASPDEEIWRAHVGQNWIGIGPTTVARGFGTDIVAGDDRTGILWMLDPSVGLDDDPVDGNPAVAFERKVTGGIQLSGRETRPCGAIQLTTAMGNPQETGASYTLRISDDHGNTWLNCGSVATVAGNYRTVVEWRGLGLMKAPGRVFEVSDSGASVRLSRLDLR